ncbi:MAG: helix-turn-helix domain-containing protein [Nitrososphaerota archaeon]
MRGAEPVPADKSYTQIVGADEIERVKVKIAGEIAISRSPGVSMKKWRQLFGERQREVASKMGVSPSVLSDYEQGKRSPGIKFVKKFVDSLIFLDLEKGGANIRHFSDSTRPHHKAILDMREFHVPTPLSKIVEAIEGEFLWRGVGRDPEIFGYTVIDSISAIRHMDSNEFIQIFGPTSMRLLVFTNVSTGRSPLVAVRVYPLKPLAVALHGPATSEQVDRLAIELAELSKIPLILTRSSSVKDLLEGLQRLD